MTGKRFTLSSVGFTDEAILHDEDVPIGNWNVHRKEIVDLLNELHEEVQSQSIVIKGYQDRNEILNQQICDKNKILLKEIGIGEKLHDENNRIKQTIQDMMETERTELGKSVLKQLYEAIQ